MDMPPIPPIPPPPPPAPDSEPPPAAASAEERPWFPSWVPPPPTDPTPPPRRGRKAILAVVVAALVLVSSGVGIGLLLTRGGGGGSTSSLSTEGPLSPAPQQTGSGGVAQNLTPAQVAARVTPGIVDVNTVVGGIGGSSRGEGAGTGMVLTSSGQVLTNNHVIAGATSITVTVAGHSGAFTATVVGADPKDDVALLQLHGVSGLSTVSLADSSSVTIGQGVVAIGNALGQGGDPTVTSGNVTAVGRTITIRQDTGGAKDLSGLIQFDAQISPGDSGGALANRSGQVVGMITAASTSSSRQRVSDTGYAIPVNTATGIVNEIRAGHETDQIILGEAGFLGVGVRNLDPADANQLGLSVSSGALVVEVIPGTPAAKAGMKANSVITAVDGTRVDSADDLGPEIYTHEPGDQIKVTWIDQSGRSHTSTVTLIAGPAV